MILSWIRTLKNKKNYFITDIRSGYLWAKWLIFDGFLACKLISRDYFPQMLQYFGHQTLQTNVIRDSKLFPKLNWFSLQIKYLEALSPKPQYMFTNFSFQVRGDERVIRSCATVRDERTDRTCYTTVLEEYNTEVCQCFEEGCNSGNM